MADSPVKMDESHGYKEPSAQTVARDGEVPVSVLEDGSLDPVYEAKAKMLNKAMQDIGMGKYQWQVSIQPFALPSMANTLYSTNLSPDPSLISIYFLPAN